jgi:predicted ATP-dependent endonuclease of OLD family
MYLKAMKIKHFRAYCDEVYVPFDNLTTFVGKNDIGKSTILEALEIFFNNKTVVCENNDLSVSATTNEIEIACIFNDLPEEIIIDSTFVTNLKDEFLINFDGDLEIKKIFKISGQKPKEKIILKCHHPTNENVSDLINLKNSELQSRAIILGIDSQNYNSNINASIRAAIRRQFENELEFEDVEIEVDKEGTKKVYEEIKKYLPIYALFQSDRQSNDGDKEILDPMNLAIQQALTELEQELDVIKRQVKRRALDTANRTLEKLKEMSPYIANSLIPEFKTEPRFDKQFKLTLNSDDNISINKRGSGVRRLILLNFFRAEAEKRKQESDNNAIIYAFEEPETSQHPEHQKILVDSFISLSNTDDCQIMITTHTPALAGIVPLESLRLIESDETGFRAISHEGEDAYEKICNSLGILPNPIPQTAKAILLVEGPSDICFVKHTAETLKASGYLDSSFEDKNIAIVPMFGCHNVIHWKTQKIAEQFNIPLCLLLDSDRNSPEDITENVIHVQEYKEEGYKAYCTRKKELENYIHQDCIDIEGSAINYSDWDNAKKIINEATNVGENKVLKKYWPLMTAEQIREVEKYVTENNETKYEFTEMFTDFLSLC